MLARYAFRSLHGSDFVLLFQAGYTFAPDSPRDDSGHGYSRMLMGQQLGKLILAGGPKPAGVR